jgi:putative addiction module killer protein
MDVRERTIRLYLTPTEDCPFEAWFDGLSDIRAQQRVLARIARLRTGNLGDWKALGNGIFELRIDFGPGYRIYFGQAGSNVVILLVGGSKDRQQREIRRAREYWSDYEKSKETKNF